MKSRTWLRMRQTQKLVSPTSHKPCSAQLSGLPRIREGTKPAPAPNRPLCVGSTSSAIRQPRSNGLPSCTLVRSMADEQPLHGQTGSKGEAWRSEAPYKVHGPNEEFVVKHEGSCHCGKVHFQLKRETPLDSKFCHCIDCQVQHGTPVPLRRILRSE